MQPVSEQKSEVVADTTMHEEKKPDINGVDQNETKAPVDIEKVIETPAAEEKIVSESGSDLESENENEIEEQETAVFVISAPPKQKPVVVEEKKVIEETIAETVNVTLVICGNSLMVISFPLSLDVFSCVLCSLFLSNSLKNYSLITEQYRNGTN